MAVTLASINKVFKFNKGEGKVRVCGLSETPWFCGKDVASILGYIKPTDAISKHVDDEDRQTLSNVRSGYPQIGDTLIIANQNESNTIYINEAGIYLFFYNMLLLI